jgi:hypothetical protein
VTTHITKRYPDIDVILLVDSAKQPMQAASISVMRSVAVSGFQDKLAVAVTHFDKVSGPNLDSFAAKRAHVMASVHNALASLRGSVGQSLVRALERRVDERCFMLGFLDRPIAKKHVGPVEQLTQLVRFCLRAIAATDIAETQPVYDPAGLLFAVQSATTDFHRRWDARLGKRPVEGISKAHWARIKALTRRIALVIDVEYGTLKPLADLIDRLTEAISQFLDSPVSWTVPPTDEERDAAISRIRREVSVALHSFVAGKLLDGPLPKWVSAFEHRGIGSTVLRARDLHEIYEDAAPVPGPAMAPDTAQFLREIRELVHGAIAAGGGKIE